MRKKSGSFFRITNHSDFCAGRAGNILDNLLKPLCNFAIVGNFTALVAQMRGYIFNYNNAAAHIGSKGRDSFICSSLTHKTDHGFLTALTVLRKAEQYPQWSFSNNTPLRGLCREVWFVAKTGQYEACPLPQYEVYYRCNKLAPRNSSFRLCGSWL